MSTSGILSCRPFMSLLPPARLQVLQKKQTRKHLHLLPFFSGCHCEDAFNRSLQRTKVSCSSGTDFDIHEHQGSCDDLSEFVLDDSKATTFVHSVWRRIVKAGDIVVDATCGNGHDTVLLATLAIGEDSLGYVYALDTQEVALHNSSSLLDQKLNFNQRKQVRLVQICHSKIEEVVKNKPVRLVAFNLGYLPGGDKSLITHSTTTLAALHAATKCVQPGGLISIIAYVGHPGGREEYDAVKGFFSGLPTVHWVCSHYEWLNRPLGPRVIFGLRKQ